MNEEHLTKILVSTTQRCGSTWIASVCSTMLNQQRAAPYVQGIHFGLLNGSQFGSNDDLKIADFTAELRKAETENPHERVFKTHDLPPHFVPLFLHLNPSFVVVNMKRDFRDVLISRLMYNRYYLPANGQPSESAFVAENQSLADHELVHRFYGTREMLDWLVNWKLFAQPLEHPRYHCFVYEQMLSPEGLGTAVDRLSLAASGHVLPVAERERTMARSTFQSIDINGRPHRRSREVKTEFCRKGVARDYERFLSATQSSNLEILMR